MRELTKRLLELEKHVSPWASGRCHQQHCHLPCPGGTPVVINTKTTYERRLRAWVCRFNKKVRRRILSLSPSCDGLVMGQTMLLVVVVVVVVVVVCR